MKAFSLESLIEVYGDQAYHKSVALLSECVRSGDGESARILSHACIVLMQCGYDNVPEKKDA